jgi:hypothetical protein
VIVDPTVMPLVRQMLDCFRQELAKVENPPARVQMRTGDIVAHLISTNDDECCAGLGWVRPVAFYPSSAAFPQQDESVTQKGVTAWAVVLELGAVRCAPTPDAHSIPTEDEWETATQAVMDDAAAMRRAICCFVDSDPTRRFIQNTVPGQWTPLPMEGGCVGGTLTVTIRRGACDCRDAGPES